MPVSPFGTGLPYADQSQGMMGGDPYADQGQGMGGQDMGGGDAMAAIMAAMQGGGAPEGAGGSQPESADFARSMLELINEWRQVETDEEDLLAIEKISTLVQMLLTRNAKEGMDAMQGKLSPRLLGQAYGQ